MLRILSFAAATAAFLVIPLTQSDARPGGMRSGGVHISSARSFSGPRSIGINRSVIVNRGPLHVGKPVHIGKHVHFRHRHFFYGGIYSAGLYGLYDTCWRWVPGAYGWRRVWVCDPYPYHWSRNAYVGRNAARPSRLKPRHVRGFFLAELEWESAAINIVPSPLAGEGGSEIQQNKSGEG
jgi:hypothetical protein